METDNELDEELYEYGSSDHVSAHTSTSIYVFFISLSALWCLNIPSLVIIYLVFCGNLLGDEEEEDREDVVTMDAMMSVVRLEAPRVINRLIDYSHDFLEFYDDLKHNHMGLGAPDVWDYSNIDFNIWLLHDFVSMIPNAEPELTFDMKIQSLYYYYSWSYNSQWQKFESKYNDFNISLVIDPEYYIEGFDINSAYGLNSYTKFSYHGDLMSRRALTGTVRGWFSTRKVQQHNMYQRLEESLQNYKTLSATIYKGLYEARYSGFLDYFWSEFVDSYKLHQDLWALDEDKFKFYWESNVDLWFFSFINYDLITFSDWSGELADFGDYKRLYYYNFYL